MISNKLLNPLILEALNDLSQEGLISLNPVLEKLMNELMNIEREQVIGASLYERSEDRKGHCNGFKNKRSKAGWDKEYMLSILRMEC